MLGPAITERHARNGSLAVVTLDPMLERELHAALGADSGVVTSLDALALQAVVEQIQETILRAEQVGHDAVVVCSPALRRPLVRLLEGVPNAPAVLSFREIGPQVALETVGTISIPSPSMEGMNP